jgi:hypothetical protein
VRCWVGALELRLGFFSDSLSFLQLAQLTSARLDQIGLIWEMEIMELEELD